MTPASPDAMESAPCPHCERNRNGIFSTRCRQGQWYCLKCETRFDGPPPAQRRHDRQQAAASREQAAAPEERDDTAPGNAEEPERLSADSQRGLAAFADGGEH